MVRVRARAAARISLVTAGTATVTLRVSATTSVPVTIGFVISHGGVGMRTGNAGTAVASALIVSKVRLLLLMLLL